MMEAAAAIADRESPHDANALALSPTVKGHVGSKLDEISSLVRFIITCEIHDPSSLVKVDGHLAAMPRLCGLSLEPPRKTYEKHAATNKQTDRVKLCR